MSGNTGWRLVALLMLLSWLGPAAAQTFDARKAEPFHDFGSPLARLTFRTDDEARRIVDEVLAKFDLKASYDVFVTDDGRNYPNAQAFFDPDTERHQLVFNRQYMEEVRGTGSRWTIYGIVAHEIAHLMALHYERRLDYHTRELEADFFAGFALAKLGATCEEAPDYLRNLRNADETVSHPPRGERVAALTRGCAYAKGEEAPDPPVASGAFDGVSPLTRFKLAYSRDIYGRDLVSVPGDIPGIRGTTLETCAKACRDVAKCKGFTFNRWRGTCFLKDSVAGPALLAPSSVTGVKQPGKLPAKDRKRPVVVKMLPGAIFYDPPLSPQDASVAGPDECARLCQANARCVLFSFFKDKKTCRLLADAEGHYRDQNVVSGYLRQDPAPGTPGSPAGPPTPACGGRPQTCR